jgi:type II secretory pathway component PulF
MKTYSYNAIDYSGKKVRGSVTAETATSATRDVTDRGLYVVSIRETTSQLATFYRVTNKFQIGRYDILEFTQSFSVMLNAGIPIIACLDDIIMSTTNKAFKPIISDIKQRLERGSSVSAALEAQGKVFPNIVKTLVVVGEESGRLEENMRKASEHLQRMLDLSAAIRKALTDPLIALTAIIAALFFWMTFVVPNLVVTLKGLGVKLPALTVAIIAISATFQVYWKYMVFGLLMMPLAIFLMGKNRHFRYARDFVLIKLPFVKTITFNKLLATFSEQFRILLVSGIAVERLFDLMIPSLGNEYLAVKLLRAKENILHGQPISESLAHEKIFPPLVISKIRVGETSGSLDKQFDFLAKYFITKLDNATDTMGKVIEPLAMVTIGGLFALMIMGLLLPIYDLVSKVGKG